MKNLLVLLIAFAACSSPKEEKQVQFSLLNVEEDEWAVYEGKIITDKGLEVDVELSLMQAAVGVDSYYELHKSLIASGVAYGPSSKGKYSVSYGLTRNEQGITITEPLIKFGNRTIDSAVKGKQFEILKMQKEEIEKVQDLLATPELYFKTAGNEKLIQTNRNFDEKGLKYVLYRRSDLFTAEGYVTFGDSITEFFERNTMKNWRVVPLGMIDSVKIKYIELATEMNEGIYLKALAYSISDTTSESNKSLVIKRVLRIEKSSMQNPIR